MSRSVNCFYAFGAGYGHITRTLAMIQYLREEALLEGRVILLTECLQPHKRNFVDRLELAEKQIEVIEANAETYLQEKRFSEWLVQQLKLCHCTGLFLDVFPFGIKGELATIYQALNNDIGLYLVARNLKWQEYIKMFPAEMPDIRFKSVYALEELNSDLQSWFDTHSEGVVKLELTYSDQYPAEINPQKENLNLPDQFRMVVHSGSEDELEQLYLWTKEKQKDNLPIVVVSPFCPDYIAECDMWLDYYPANQIIPLATSVTSAAGFNIIHAMRHIKIDHWIMPFPRKFDDQFLRAKLARG